MSYRQTGRRRASHQAWKPEECIYCPLKKPIAWPIIFLLFAFSPFLFSTPTVVNKSAISSVEIQPNNPIHTLTPPDVEIARPDHPEHIPGAVTSGK